MVCKKVYSVCFGLLFVFQLGCSLTASLDSLRESENSSVGGTPTFSGSDYFAGKGFIKNKLGDFDYGRFHRVRALAGNQFLAGGTCGDSSDPESFCIVKFNLDGSLVTSFGFDGQASVGGYSGDYFDFDVDSAGRIVVFGSSFQDMRGRSGHAFRITANGEIDRSFGVNGFISFSFEAANNSDEFFAGVVSPSGDIFVGGYGYQASTGRGIIVKYDSSGQLASSFGVGGVLELDFASTMGEVKVMKFTSSGKLLVASDNYTYSASLALIDPLTGALDTSFSGDGKLNFKPGASIVSVGDVYIDSDGSIFLYGSAGVGPIIAKFSSAGVLDTGFDSDGYVDLSSADFNLSDKPRLAKTADSKLMVNGMDSVENAKAVLYSLNLDGSVNSVFGAGGKVTFEEAPLSVSLNDWIYSAGCSCFVVVGTTQNASSNDAGFVQKLSLVGVVDSSFNGGTGKKVFSMGNEYDWSKGLLKLSSGLLLQIGRDSTDLILIRRSELGEMDSSFGVGGVLRTNVKAADDHRLVELPGSGALYLLAKDTNSLPCILRLNADGTIDSTFGVGGMTVGSNFGFTSARFYDLAVMADGSVFAVGEATNSNQRFLVVKYTAAGVLDLSFNSTGFVTQDFGSSTDIATSVLIDEENGSLFVGGYARPSTNTQFTVLNYSFSGVLNNTFASSGILSVGVGSSGSGINRMVFDNSGRVVAAGWAFGVSRDFAVVRFSKTGVLDTNFSGDGMLTVDIRNGFDDLKTVFVDSQDRILLGGSSEHATASDVEMAAARVTVTGTLDSSFGTSGVWFSNWVEGLFYETYLTDFAETSDGRLLFVGSLDNETGSDFFIGRLTNSGALGL